MFTPTVRLSEAAAFSRRVLAAVEAAVCGVLSNGPEADTLGLFRMFVRFVSLGCGRTSACIVMAGRTEAEPECPAFPSTTLRCLCPNTKCRWVPVVTQRTFSCPTIHRSGSEAAPRCGSSTPTNSPLLTRSLPPVCDRAPRALPRALSLSLPPTPLSPVAPMVACCCGRRTGGRPTSALTVSSAPIRCRCLSGGC